MMRQLLLDLVEPAAPCFASFVAGRNAEAKRRVEAVAAGTSEEHFVYLWGVQGSGRSHLLQAARGAVQEARRAATYVSCDATTDSFPPVDVLDCLLVDDVERLGERGQIALFNAYNGLRERGASLVAAGDAPPVQLALRPDVITRLGWGLVYQLHPLSDDEKRCALAEYAAQRGFALQDEVSEHLMRHVARDMGSLLAALDALDRYSLESHRPVTLALVRELVRARTTSTG